MERKYRPWMLQCSGENEQGYLHSRGLPRRDESGWNFSIAESMISGSRNFHCHGPRITAIAVYRLKRAAKRAFTSSVIVTRVKDKLRWDTIRRVLSVAWKRRQRFFSSSSFEIALYDTMTTGRWSFFRRRPWMNASESPWVKYFSRFRFAGQSPRYAVRACGHV